MNPISRINPHILSCAIAATLGVAAFTAPPPAHAIVVHDPVQTTKSIIDRLREHKNSLLAQTTRLKQYTQMLKDYQEMVRQGLSLGDEVFDMVQSPIAELIDIYHDSRETIRSLGNIDKEFRQRYKGYGDYMQEMLGGTSPYNMSNSHARFSNVGSRPVLEKVGEGEQKKSFIEEWHESTLDTVSRALTGAGIPTSAFDTDKEMLNKVMERSSNAQGRMQALQAGNEISSMMAQQLGRLNILVGELINFQGKMAAQHNERTTMAAIKHQVTQGAPPKRTRIRGFRAN